MLEILEITLCGVPRMTVNCGCWGRAGLGAGVGAILCMVGGDGVLGRWGEGLWGWGKGEGL